MERNKFISGAIPAPEEDDRRGKLVTLYNSSTPMENMEWQCSVCAHKVDLSDGSSACTHIGTQEFLQTVDDVHSNDAPRISTMPIPPAPDLIVGDVRVSRRMLNHCLFALGCVALAILITLLLSSFENVSLTANGLVINF